MKPEILIPVAAAVIAFVLGYVAGKGSSKKKPGARKSKPAKQKRGGTGGKVELYVGNLAYTVRTKDLKQTFEKFGKVASARIIQNKFNGKSKGFGFVEMADKGGAHAAVKALNGTDVKGRKIVVNEARERSRD